VRSQSGLMASRLKDMAVASSEDLVALVTGAEEGEGEGAGAQPDPALTGDGSTEATPFANGEPGERPASQRQPRAKRIRDPNAIIQQISDEEDIVIEVDLEAGLQRVSQAADALMGTFGSGLSSMTSFVSKVITVSDPGKGVGGAAGARSTTGSSSKRPGRPVVVDRRSALIAALAADPDTYMTDPLLPGPEGGEQVVDPDFCAFKASFDLAHHVTRISRLLREDAALEGLMERLVPGIVSPLDFWTRYFYKVSVIDREESARRRVLDGRVQLCVVAAGSEAPPASVTRLISRDYNFTMGRCEQGPGRRGGAGLGVVGRGGGGGGSRCREGVDGEED
jgi:hypothetical protein